MPTALACGCAANRGELSSSSEMITFTGKGDVYELQIACVVFVGQLARCVCFR
jgi:hypothetical protein